MAEFALTDIEVACGVTLPEVRQCREQAFVLHDRAVCLPSGAGPALSTAASRMALGVPTEFVGFNQFRQPIYRATRST